MLCYVMCCCFNVLATEFETLYHPDLRQDVFIKDEFHYLNVPRIGTYTVYDIFDCNFECLSNPSCFSVNLAASKGADEKMWCELLSSTKFAKPEEFRENESAHHFPVKVGLITTLELWIKKYCFFQGHLLSNSCLKIKILQIQRNLFSNFEERS